MIEESPWPFEVLVEIFNRGMISAGTIVQTLSPSRPYTKVVEDFIIYTFFISFCLWAR